MYKYTYSLADGDTVVYPTLSVNLFKTRFDVRENLFLITVLAPTALLPGGWINTIQ